MREGIHEFQRPQNSNHALYRRAVHGGDLSLVFEGLFSAYAEKIKAKKVQYEKELADLHSVKQKAATLDDLQREFDDLTDEVQEGRTASCRKPRKMNRS